MRRRGRGVLVLLALTTIAVGCRGLLGIEDRNVIADDAGAVEASDDVELPETEPPPSGYCDALSPKPAFCADFDEGALAKGFENEDKTPDPGEFGGGHITRDTTTIVSRPASAAFTLPTLLTSSTRASAFLLKPFAPVPSAVRIDFDLRVSTEYFQPKEAGNVILATLHFVPTCSVELTRDSVGTALAVYVGKSGTQTSIVSLTEGFPVGVWKRVTIYVHAGEDAGGIAEVSIDNIPAASAPIPLAFPTPATQLNVSVGAVFGRGPTGVFAANIDNVRVYTAE